MTKPTTVILTDAAADLWGSHMLVNLDRPELTKLPEGALIHPDHKVHAAYSATDGDGRPAGHLWKGSYQDESRKTWFVRDTRGNSSPWMFKTRDEALAVLMVMHAAWIMGGYNSEITINH